MSKVPPFHSVNEEKKTVDHRVYHNDNSCPSGRDIPKNERVVGTGGYRLCMHCRNL
jgi:hypothetical protein